MRLGAVRASRPLPTGNAPVPRVGSCSVTSSPTFCKGGHGWGPHALLPRVRWMGGSGRPCDSGPWSNGRRERRPPPHGRRRGQRASRSRPRTHRPGASKRRSRRSVSSLLRDDTAIHRVSATHPAVRTSMECVPTMMQTVPTTIRAVPPSSARQRASFTAGPIEIMTGAEGASRAASAPAGSRGQGMALPGAPRMRCGLPSVAMVFHTIGRDPLPARAESKSGREEPKDHPEGTTYRHALMKDPFREMKVPTGRAMPARGKTTLRRRGAGYRRPRCLPEALSVRPRASSAQHARAPDLVQSLLELQAIERCEGQVDNLRLSIS